MVDIGQFTMYTVHHITDIWPACECTCVVVVVVLVDIETLVMEILVVYMSTLAISRTYSVHIAYI